MKMRSLILIAVAAVAVAAALSVVPTSAQPANCGGYWGEGCWSPRARQQLYRQHGYPEWGGFQRGYIDPRFISRGRSGQHFIEPGHFGRGHQRTSRGQKFELNARTTTTVRVEHGFEEVERTGIGRSLPPGDHRCQTLPGGYRLCPNVE